MIVPESRIFFAIDEQAGEQVSVSLKQANPETNWDSILFLVNDFSKAISSANEEAKEPIVVSLALESEETKLQSDADKVNFDLGVSVSVPELEYVKDEAGRQIVNLGRPHYEQSIFERLVREGMNPVLAHPDANDALHQLRGMNEVKVLFFIRKNLINELKNLDLE